MLLLYSTLTLFHKCFLIFDCSISITTFAYLHNVGFVENISLAKHAIDHF